MFVKYGLFTGEHKYSHKQCLGGYSDANIIEVMILNTDKPIYRVMYRYGSN